MESFIVWLFTRFSQLIETLTRETVSIINNVLDNAGQSVLNEFEINLVLFSETPILYGDGWSITALFFSIFYTVIFIVIVWKIIKKVFTKITGWHRW